MPLPYANYKAVTGSQWSVLILSHTVIHYKKPIKRMRTSFSGTSQPWKETRVYRSEYSWRHARPSPGSRVEDKWQEVGILVQSLSITRLLRIRRPPRDRRRDGSDTPWENQVLEAEVWNGSTVCLAFSGTCKCVACNAWYSQYCLRP